MAQEHQQLLPLSVTSALDLHIIGVGSLQQKRYGDAVSILKGVVRGLQEQLRRIESKVQKAPLPQDIAVPSYHFGPPLDKYFSSDAPFFVFTCPLVFVKRHAVELVSNTALKVILTRLSVATIYNLAVTHHLGVLNTENSSNVRLQKILDLYEMARKLLRDEHFLSVGDDSDDLYPLGFILDMAIGNNIGLVHGLLQDKVKEAQSFQELLSAIMVANSCGTSMSIPHLEGFSRNIQRSVWHIDNSASAA